MRTFILIDEFKDLKYILNYYNLKLSIDLSDYERPLLDSCYLQFYREQTSLYLCVPYAYIHKSTSNLVVRTEVVFFCKKPFMISFLEEFYI